MTQKVRDLERVVDVNDLLPVESVLVRPLPPTGLDHVHPRE